MPHCDIVFSWCFPIPIMLFSIFFDNDFNGLYIFVNNLCPITVVSILLWVLMHSCLLPLKKTSFKRVRTIRKTINHELTNTTRNFYFSFILHYLLFLTKIFIVQNFPISTIILSKTWATNAYFVINVQIDLSFACLEPYRYSSIIVVVVVVVVFFFFFLIRKNTKLKYFTLHYIYQIIYIKKKSELSGG